MARKFKKVGKVIWIIAIVIVALSTALSFVPFFFSR